MLGAEIIGEKILLRPHVDSDITAWQRWDIDPAVQEYMPEPRNEVQADAQQRVYLQECVDDESGIYWSVVWREADEVVGSVAITEIDRYHGTGEVGILIGEKSCWGKGIAREVLRLVCGAAPSFGLRRLTAECEVENIGMRRAFEAAGFYLEAVCVESRIKQGRPIDTMRYYILV